jgi:hypothetical protein
MRHVPVDEREQRRREKEDRRIREPRAREVPACLVHPGPHPRRPAPGEEDAEENNRVPRRDRDEEAPRAFAPDRAGDERGADGEERAVGEEAAEREPSVVEESVADDRRARDAKGEEQRSPRGRRWSPFYSPRWPSGTNAQKHA